MTPLQKLFFCYNHTKKPVYIFAFGEFNSQQVNGIKHFLAKLYGLELHKEILNAANIYLLGIKLTKCKYIDRSFVLLFHVSFSQSFKPAVYCIMVIKHTGLIFSPGIKV